MKFDEYYITDTNGKSNCVIRSFCKIYNEKYSDVANELVSISEELKCNFNDIETFEEYMNRRNTKKIDYGTNLVIKDLSLDNDKYIIFCYDKKDFYHMVPVINNTVYDYNDDSLKLYVISIYKVNP
jgi:hypothetical protein